MSIINKDRLVNGMQMGKNKVFVLYFNFDMYFGYIYICIVFNSC